jgi:multidrug efflux system outer membrane protein
MWYNNRGKGTTCLAIFFVPFFLCWCGNSVGVAPAYFDLRQFDMQLEIAKRTLLAWEESVRIGQARFRQGLINKLDVDHFEAEGENAAARIAELKRHMIQKENELSATL